MMAWSREVSVEGASELIHDKVLWYFQLWNEISYPSKRVATRKPKKGNVSVKGKWLTEAVTWRGKEKCIILYYLLFFSLL